MIDLRTRPVTEEEAKAKICPFTFAIAEIPHVMEGGPLGCKGSICMLWRWHKDGTSTVQETGVGFCGGGGPL